MTEIIQMDFEKMEEMAERFRSGSQQLEDLQQVIRAIAQTYARGALLGNAGSRFSHDLEYRLAPAIVRLQDKLHELQLDIIGAMVDLRDSDSSIRPRFS
jgi:WXG100 family type VII secretion target